MSACYMELSSLLILFLSHHSIKDVELVVFLLDVSRETSKFLNSLEQLRDLTVNLKY